MLPSQGTDRHRSHHSSSLAQALLMGAQSPDETGPARKADPLVEEARSEGLEPPTF